MEKMVLRRLTFHLHSCNLLPEDQYGFREGYCTADQILYCQRIRDAHKRKPTNHTVAVFLDLSKVFDRIWNNLLVMKLFKNFGIGGKALPWIYDFSRNRLIRKSDSDLTKLERDINLVLEDIRNFTLDHKINYNHTKCVISFFTTNRKLYNFQTNIFLYNHPLTIEKHPKYLGFILDPEILGNKHNDNIVFKARKRLNILRYISGRDWGADAGTLRNAYISIRRPILEYVIPVYCSASNTNLQKIQKVQLGAAWIITDLQPLSLRRRACLTKYYNKLRSLDSQNRTSTYFNDWSNNQRIRTNNPFNRMVSFNLTIGAVEPHYLSQFLDPADDLDRVFFHPELPVSTDVSTDDNYRSGSGIYIKSQDHILKIQRRNPDGCLVSRNELIAIDEVLGSLASLPNGK
ncbi:putative RNA-directed DNA polymerase from transposon X-element [Trichonephila clavipes]|nr:putative RNA-directed DNA polymerase from transposon X-element [Trichonephila clavipes]